MLNYSEGRPIPLPFSQGGTGSTSQNFVDISTTQSISGTKTFTNEAMLPSGTLVGQSNGSITAGISYYQGTGGTPGNLASIRADFNNLYLTNTHGRVVAEAADDQSHSVTIQEESAPFESFDWWFDGSSVGSTGGWFAVGSHAPSINLQLGDTSGTGLIQIRNSSAVIVASIDSKGVIYPGKFTTVAAPAYVKGGIYFDTTLNKLRVGGATGWETITSV